MSNSRRPLKVVLAVLFVGAVLAPPVLAGGEASLLLGKKDLSLDVPSELSDLEDQSAYGALLTFGTEWPVSLAVDILSSSSDDSAMYTYDYYGYTYEVDAKFEVDVVELDIGVRKQFGKNRIKGYVGGGLCIAAATLTAKGTLIFDEGTVPLSEDDSDTGIGYFLNGGVLFNVTDRFHLGVDVRKSQADVTVFDSEDDFDVGGTTYGVFAGFRWGN